MSESATSTKMKWIWCERVREWLLPYAKQMCSVQARRHTPRRRHCAWARALRYKPTTNFVCKIKSKMWIHSCFAWFSLQLPSMNVHTIWQQLKQKIWTIWFRWWNVLAENWNTQFIFGMVWHGMHAMAAKWNEKRRHEWAHSQRPFRKSTLKWKMLSFILIKYEMYTVPIHTASVYCTLYSVFAVRICSLLNGK